LDKYTSVSGQLRDIECPVPDPNNKVHMQKRLEIEVAELIVKRKREEF
jgi:hypothetical protein